MLESKDFIWMMSSLGVDIITLVVWFVNVIESNVIFAALWNENKK